MSQKFDSKHISLGWYNPDEILKISCCEVTLPVSFDIFGHPVLDGLYDLRMGPLNMDHICKTCNLGYFHCPGHFGHFKLSRTVMNPLCFDTAYALIKSCCSNCYHFKITSIERLVLYTKLKVLKKGIKVNSVESFIANKSIEEIENELSKMKEERTGYENSQHASLVAQFIRKISIKATCPRCHSKNPKISKGTNLRILKTGSSGLVEFVSTSTIKEVISKLYENEGALLSEMFNSDQYNMFFIDILPIVPNKFRPAMFGGSKVSESPINSHFCRMINFSVMTDNDDRFWSDLQAYVLFYFDSAKGPVGSFIGHKQILEKKEGLFRKNIMGKRVNYSARSVISPDPNLETREIGVPLVFARQLTFPEKVNSFNIDKMRKLVINGTAYPGANFIQDNNALINLKYISVESRLALANQLWDGNKTVWRHLVDGDPLLVNRQPTLHSVSLMGHIAKVLKNEKTLRLHYVNCKSYNADFDGDEMNVHFPQSFSSMSELYNLALNDNSFFVPSSGEPIRGLTQDHIIAALLLTMKDSFFNVEEYHSLVNAGLSNLKNRDLYIKSKYFSFQEPCIQSPLRLYSGKQVITTILKNLNVFINFTVKSKMNFPGEEGVFSVFNGELISGALDKASVGASSFSLIHACGEVYGYTICNDLLTIISRIVNRYMAIKGFTIRFDDLLFDSRSNRERSRLFLQGNALAMLYQKLGCSDSFEQQLIDNFNIPNTDQLNEVDPLIISDSIMNRLNTDQLNEVDPLIISDSIMNRFNTGRSNPNQLNGIVKHPMFDEEDFYFDENKISNLDKKMRSFMNNFTTKVVKLLDTGMMKKFPTNNMANVILSGSKGSMVNLSQISSALGQQELEGKRVPFMESGKTLPCFRKLELCPSAGGFLFERFLTGINPATFYFHAMAGREGLIDTAVKTANSGYLQRCLAKHLESVSVSNDRKVMSDNRIIQFVYGDDGTDCTKGTYLKNADFYRSNLNLFNKNKAYSDTRTVDSQVPDNNIRLNTPSTNDHNISSHEDAMINHKINYEDTMINHKINSHEDTMINYEDLVPNAFKKIIEHQPNYLKNFIKNRFINSLVNPGHSVGIIAAQSLGEPSTQMTLNTFHLAGVGGKNVTLGIPRLREIIMVASKNIKTPIVTAPIFNQEDSPHLQSIFQRITLEDCLEKVTVQETFVIKDREYKKHIKIIFDIGSNTELCIKVIDLMFLKALGKELKKRSSSSGIIEYNDTHATGSAADNNAVDNEEGVPEMDEDSSSSSDNKDDVRENDMEASQKKYNREDGTDEKGDNDPASEMDGEDLIDEANANEPINGIDGEGFLEDLDKIIETNKDQFNEDAKIGIENSGEEELNIPLVNLKKITSKRFCFEIYYDSDFNILILPIIESIVKSLVVKQIPGFKKATVESKLIYLEGSDFLSLTFESDGLDLFEKIDFYHSRSNDINAIYQAFGVEAARETIVYEITSVFDVYGIKIDIRHLYLVADYMTRDGTFKAFNRNAFSMDDSFVQRMSFESCFINLKNAAIFNQSEAIKNPSSCLLTGSVLKSGTGSFDVFYDMTAFAE